MLKLSKNAVGMLVAGYRAVLRHMSLKNRAALFCCASLLFSSPAFAEDVTYDGTNPPLQQPPAWTGWIGQALYPGAAGGNTVTVNYTPGGGMINPDYVLGGLSQYGEVRDNRVYMINGMVNYDLYGGYSGSGDVAGNSVTISGGSVGGVVYGGESFGSGNVTGNSVTLSGGSADFVHGGSSYGSGNAAGNSVTLSGASVTGNVFGGFSDSGNATGNSVILSAGSAGTVYGGYSLSSGNVTGNSVTFSGGSATSVFGGESFGSGNVTGNSVTISGGSVNSSVIGGDSFSGDVTGNSVTISGGSAGYVVGGFSTSGTATGNSVTISGGSADYVFGGGSFSGTATGNSVTLSGGSVTGIVAGGSSVFGNATGNTVTLSGGSVTGSVFGSFSESATGDLFTGNTLNVSALNTSVGRDVGNFQNYYFLLPSAINNGDTMLTVTGTANLTNGSGTAQGTISSVIQNVNILGGGRMQQVGESFTLIDASSGSLVTNPDFQTTAWGLKNVSLFYSYDLSTANNVLSATIKGVQVNPAIPEGRAASLSFLRQGADLVAGDGLRNAWQESQNANRQKVSFSALEGGSSRYKTGSHVDVGGVSLVTGIASRRSTDTGDVMSGVFLEAGMGSYDSFNAFSQHANVRGNGDTSYYGMGVVARSEKNDGMYREGSLRLGRAKTDFDSADLRSITGLDASYDSSSLYWGAHLGLGKVRTTGKKTLDVYGKYLFTHQSGDDVVVAGDAIRFSGSDSHRIRTGVRVSHAKSDRVTTYAGAAYEYEFDGKSKAFAYGYDSEAPGVKGSTGILELGARWNKGANGDVLELGLNGYVGKRRGLSGSLRFTHVF